MQEDSHDQMQEVKFLNCYLINLLLKLKLISEVSIDMFDCTS